MAKLLHIYLFIHLFCRLIIGNIYYRKIKLLECLPGYYTRFHIHLILSES
jgi:hypothetical protein